MKKEVIQFKQIEFVMLFRNEINNWYNRYQFSVFQNDFEIERKVKYCNSKRNILFFIKKFITPFLLLISIRNHRWYKKCLRDVNRLDKLWSGDPCEIIACFVSDIMDLRGKENSFGILITEGRAERCRKSIKEKGLGGFVSWVTQQVPRTFSWQSDLGNEILGRYKRG